MNKMGFESHQIAGAQFCYPGGVKVVEEECDPGLAVCKLEVVVEEKAVGQLFVTVVEATQERTAAYLAFLQRGRLRAKGLEVKDSALLPAPVPERFEGAWYYSPQTSSNQTKIEVATVIFKKGELLVGLDLIGPGKDWSPEICVLNLEVFQIVRDTLVVVGCENVGQTGDEIV